MRIFMNLVMAIFLFTSSEPAFSYPSDAVNNQSQEYKQAVDYVNAKEYTKAIPLFLKVVSVDPNNADAYNYLGYSYRQIGKLDDALNYYNSALKINPNHKGANEYLGELYLMKKDLPKAEERLQVLKKVCPTGCIEYTTLQNNINIFKENGNKPNSGGY